MVRRAGAKVTQVENVAREMDMRIREFALAASLLAGILLVAARVEAIKIQIPILNASYLITSSNDPNSNTCFVTGIDNEFDASGFVVGTGTAGQAVRIDYNTFRPTNASRNSAKISVKQSSFSTLRVTLDAANITGDVPVDNCAISGSVNNSKMTGSVSTSCGGGNLFGGLTDDQARSVQTAFSATKTVSFKVNSAGKWSLKINCSGAAGPAA
jgi:hypothetical protein